MATADGCDDLHLEFNGVSMEKDRNLAFQVLFLDADRNPIKAQDYKLLFNGVAIRGKTGNDGLTKKVYTQTPDDLVSIAIERIDGSLKIVGQVLSGRGSKLVTLVSPKVAVKGPTLPHPQPPEGHNSRADEKPTPLYDPKQNQAPTTARELGTKTELTATKDGKPLIKVTGDIPTLEFLDKYTGEVMEEEDFLWAARELDVELAAIKAFAEVESKGAGFIKIGQRQVPKILFERHKFAKFTENEYSAVYPDISLPCGYYNAKDRYVLAEPSYKKKRGIPEQVNYYRPVSQKDDEETTGRTVLLKSLIEEGKLTAADHKYLDGLGSYKRLVKAYQLNPEAALKSCSWGAFQIMGEFWREMKYADAREFTKAMSRSEKEQIKSFVLYVKYVSPKIRDLLRELNWEGVANAFNGPSYKVNGYDEKLKTEYEKFRRIHG